MQENEQLRGEGLRGSCEPQLKMVLPRNRQLCSTNHKSCMSVFYFSAMIFWELAHVLIISQYLLSDYFVTTSGLLWREKALRCHGGGGQAGCGSGETDRDYGKV